MACDGGGMQTLKRAGDSGLSCIRAAVPAPVIKKLTSRGQSNGEQVIVDARDAARLPDDVEPVSEAQLVDQADALISLGGDGTMLGALRLVAQQPCHPRREPRKPRLPGRGRAAEVDAALDQLDTGDYAIEEHSAAVLTDGGDESIAFNDIALASVPGEGRCSVADRNGAPSGRCRCDALVIATPIGSTASPSRRAGHLSHRCSTP